MWIDRPLNVPYVSQMLLVAGLGRHVAEFACGPACAAMVAAYFNGGNPRLDSAVELVGGRSIVGRGVQPWQVAATVKSLSPAISSDAAVAPSQAAAWSVIEREIRNRRPLIALVRPSWVVTSINHYVVVTAFDARRQVIHVNDPLAGDQVALRASVFGDAWRHVRGIKPLQYVWMR